MKKFIKGYIFICLMFAGGLTACTQHQKVPKEPIEAQHQRDSVLEAATEKRNAWHQQLNQMNIEQLLAELSSESMREMESFNSSAFKALVSRGAPAADSVKNHVLKNDRSSLLALTALSIIDRGKFLQVNTVLKADIFTDALKQYKKFNAFGLPHIKWEDAARAIIVSGDSVKHALYPLLQDTAAAPVWGSEDYMEYKKYQYRVCDYVLALLLSTEQRNVQLPVSQAERDKMIKELKK